MESSGEILFRERTTGQVRLSASFSFSPCSPLALSPFLFLLPGLLDLEALGTFEASKIDPQEHKEMYGAQGQLPWRGG
jgi:hypothetical protein